MPISVERDVGEHDDEADPPLLAVEGDGVEQALQAADGRGQEHERERAEDQQVEPAVGHGGAGEDGVHRVPPLE